MIKLQIIGHLGRDCTVNTVNGQNVINFTVAHTEKFKDRQGNMQERTTWVDCAYWTDRTGIAPYLLKGTQVYAEGPPEVKTFTRQDGTAGASLTMRVMQVQLLGKGKESPGGSAPVMSQEASSGKNQVSNPADITEPVDDLPF